MHQKEMLRPRDVAPTLGVSVSRVYQLIAARELPACRVGGAIRIPRLSFEAWLRERDEAATAALRRGDLEEGRPAGPTGDRTTFSAM